MKSIKSLAPFLVALCFGLTCQAAQAKPLSKAAKDEFKASLANGYNSQLLTYLDEARREEETYQFRYFEIWERGQYSLTNYYTPDLAKQVKTFLKYYKAHPEETDCHFPVLSGYKKFRSLQVLPVDKNGNVPSLIGFGKLWTQEVLYSPVLYVFKGNRIDDIWVSFGVWKPFAQVKQIDYSEFNFSMRESMRLGISCYKARSKESEQTNG